jgi:hypothetical protein
MASVYMGSAAVKAIAMVQPNSNDKVKIGL